VASALHPDRVRAAVLIGGYSIQNTVTRPRAAAPETARRLWYQWYFNTDAGRAGLEENRRGLCELLWREWSPTWRFSDKMFNLTAGSFDNPDFVDCDAVPRHRTATGQEAADFGPHDLRARRRRCVWASGR
jgi:pimeloyl-ACP methyl ester carboxylesterase